MSKRSTSPSLSTRRSIRLARRTLRLLYGAAHRDFDVPSETPQYANAVHGDLHRERVAVAK